MSIRAYPSDLESGNVTVAGGGPVDLCGSRRDDGRNARPRLPETGRSQFEIASSSWRDVALLDVAVLDLVKSSGSDGMDCLRIRTIVTPACEYAGEHEGLGRSRHSPGERRFIGSGCGWNATATN